MAIEKIAVGDFVWAYDISSGELVKRRVRRLFKHPNQRVLQLQYSNTVGEQCLLTATPEHPFWVEGRGWESLGDLRVGNLLRSLSGSEFSRVVSIKNREQPVDVYNFEVDGAHNYFVGTPGVLVHNSSRNPSAGRTSPTIPFPQAGSTEFRSLVASVKEQIQDNGSFAVLNPQKRLADHIGKDRFGIADPDEHTWIFNPDRTKRIRPGYQSIDYFVGPRSIRAGAGTPLSRGQNQLMEAIRLWGHQLMAESFGDGVIAGTSVEARFSKRPSGGNSADEKWHTDGNLSTMSIIFSPQGPGTELLSPQPTLPNRYDYRYPDSIQGISYMPFSRISTDGMLVFASQGMDRHPSLGIFPTIHRAPHFDEPRFLYVIRGYDQSGIDALK